ncbi:kinesin-like protein nack1 [Phtheirospermum japonicum]|uniref:Kinesin-like protein nack1 n=1 Tax=Phtheirospermum japonicum TaxID=374723 RepID=A0A830C4F8_9LAMI|nr:kinesin-like protein nack1 [Phtheirospermum japonicum]
MEITENGEKLTRGNDERISVSVRVRPLNDKEFSSNDVSDWECVNDDTIVYKNVSYLASERSMSMYPTAYTFDRIFSSDCSTREVYEQGAKDVAISVVRGINSTVFAYGQTSSGKTYTMTGITEYAVADIFDYIHKHSNRDFILKFSAMEIYNESVRDLLSSDSIPLRLLDDPERGTIVEKLGEEILRDQNHVKELLSICKAQRQIGEMALNEMSSRSHHIIRLTIESSSREFLGRNNTSTLAAAVNFVDLAGSEGALAIIISNCKAKTGCKDPNGHIPYRDSKLTRILETSLGGNARTAIICTMSPARSHVKQSRNTLLFAASAKEVTTKARVNVVISDKPLVMHLQKELARLESELRYSRPGFAPSNYSMILREKDSQIEKLEKEVKDLILQRDIAQSQVKEFIQILGDDASSMTQVGSGHYPHFRVKYSPDSEIGKQEASQSDDDDLFLDVDNASFTEEHVKVPFFEDNFEHGYMSPRILLSSSNSSMSDSYHVWAEIEKQSNRALKNDAEPIESNFSSFEDNTNFPIVKVNRQKIELAHPTDDDNEVKENVTAEIVPSDEFKDNNDFSTIQYLDITSFENCLDKDSFGGKSLNLTRSSSWRASITSDSSSPWFKLLEYGGNTPTIGLEKESDGCGFTGKDCQNSQENAPDIETDTSAAKDTSEKDELQKEQEITIGPENGTSQKVDVAPKKNVNYVELDPIEDECKGLTSWPVEFRRLQREIIELWHACNVSLAHRTYFFLIFQGDPSDAIYLEVELRRMKFLKDKFTRGDKTVVDGRPLTLSSSAKALRQERRTLSKQMSKRFSEHEREKMFIEWGIQLDSKLRRLQLAHRVWSNTDDINHITDSAFLVAKLVGLIEPGQAPNRDMFGVNFTAKCSSGICSFKRSLVSLL